jgi:hypothetical protein
MSAIVTDQFRILNASNFIESIENSSNSYYVFLSLPNPAPATVGFGRTGTNLDNYNQNPPNPTDNFSFETHYKDTMLFGKKITSSNVRRLIRKVTWTRGARYEMYRHDYSADNLSPITQQSRLYDTNYYVVNSDFRVYICIDNGSSGDNVLGNVSQDEPTFIDLEPTRAGESGDGYLWKYLFSVSPSDIIKFDSTEYIAVPNNWFTSTDPLISSIRDSGNSLINENQIKKIYIENKGSNYSPGLGNAVNILGDGENGTAIVDVNDSGEIIDVRVSSGGKKYSYGLVDLSILQPGTTILDNPAHLIPIIPPSKGHGFDLYKELGTDRVLIYARFDDSTKDFPIDTSFAQIGIIKNPTSYDSDVPFNDNEFSSLQAIKFSSISGTPPQVGNIISQSVSGNKTAFGYVASWDSKTMVLKYFQDRSLYYNNVTYDQKDYVGISSVGQPLPFESSSNPVIAPGFSGSIDQGFDENFVVIDNQTIFLSATFDGGLANSEINKESGDIIYIDNRPLISRNLRQKEDVKIILEF